jgi:hypothetical protein
VNWHTGLHSALRIELAGGNVVPEKTHYVNIRARVRNGQVLSIVGKAQGIDRMTARII